MDEARVVGVLERVEDVLEDDADQPRRKAEPLDAGAREQGVEISACEELHREPVEAGVELDAEVVDAGEVRVTEAGAVARFGEEALAQGGRQAGLEDLDCDVALEHRIVGPIHGAHAAFTELLDDSILLAVKQRARGVERPAMGHDLRRGSKGLGDPSGGRHGLDQRARRSLRLQKTAQDRVGRSRRAHFRPSGGCRIERIGR